MMKHTVLDRDSNPLVSVILPCYNGSETIRDAVESVLGQSYFHYELLVVDDASTDDSLEILRSYGEKIRLIERKSNSGICELARQDAIRVARGKYLALIDQDDLWEPEKLRLQVAFMEEHPQYPLSHHYARVLDDHGMTGEIRHMDNIPPSGPCAKEMMRHCFITASAIMVLPEAWQAGIQAHGNRHSNADIEQFLEIERLYPAGVGFIPEVLGSYRRWSRSMSRQDWRWGPEDVNALVRVYEGEFWRGLMSRSEARCLLQDAFLANSDHWRHAGYPARSSFFAWTGLHYGWLNRHLWVALLKAIVRSLHNS